MIPFQERKKLRKILYSRITILVLFVVFIAVAGGAWGISQKAGIARTERDIAEKSLAELQNRTRELEMSLERLNSSKGSEEEIRLKYTVARPGEEVVVVVDEQAKKSENNEVIEEQGFLTKLLSVFGL